MRMAKCFYALVVLLHAASGAAQTAQRWSVERNILPTGLEAREAKLVILSNGDLVVTFRGSEIETPDVGGIFFTRSGTRGYSWSRPRPAVSVPGVQGVTHEVQSDGENLLLYVTVFRPPRFEVLQFLSTDQGQTWRQTETVFVNTDPVRALLTWQLAGRMYLMALTERARAERESEFSFWLVRGRVSGAYWDPPVKVKTIFATSIAYPRLVDEGPGRMPKVFWVQNGFQDQIMEMTGEDITTWRDRIISPAPRGRTSIQQDRGVSYMVRTTSNRQILFNRTDDEPPTTSLVTTIPRSLNKSTLKVVWQGKDNYTLPRALRYEVQLDEQAAQLITNATAQEFTNLLNGNHRITLTAIDEAGNRQNPPTVERFQVQVLPVPKFTNPAPGDLLNKDSVTVAWEGEHNTGPEHDLLYSLKVNDREWTDFSSETSMLVEGLTDGEHAFFLRAKDVLENISADGASVRFEVDTTPPTCVVEELPRDWERRELPWPDLPDYQTQFRVTGSDNRTPADELEYRFRLNEAQASPWTTITEPTILSGLPDGTHRIAFETRDEAQNTQTEPTVLTFDYNTPPNTRAWLDETREPPTYRFAGKDSNTTASDLTFRWRIDDGPWSDWTSESEVIANHILQDISHGEHLLYVQSRDPAGNMDATPAELIIEVDKIPPASPAGLSVISRDDGAVVELRWEAVPETNVRYNVYRSEQGTFTREESVLIAPGIQRSRTSDQPRRMDNAVTYYYFVTALDRADNESEPSPPQLVEVLGMTEIREKEYQEIASRIDVLVRDKRWGLIDESARNAPEPPPGWEAYPSYWAAVAKGGMTLSETPPDLQKLLAARAGLGDFLDRYPGFSQADQALELFKKVKSQILWNRLKTYGTYGAILAALLIVVMVVYRWIQNRRIPEMPKITVTEGVEDITPSKEALKDATVLRRWAEVQADSSSAENWSRLAFAFHNIGEVDNSIQSLYKALEIDPNNTRFHFQMGHFQKEAGNMKESIRHFERYLQLNPESKKSAEEVRELLKKLKEQSEK